MEKYKIPVVSAILYDNRTNKILIAKRKYPALEINQWCFPGGKVQAEENLFQALRREVKEETDLDIDINDPKLIGTCCVGCYVILFFTITKFTGILYNREPDKIETYDWIYIKQLYELNLTEGMKLFSQTLLLHKFLESIKSADY